MAGQMHLSDSRIPGSLTETQVIEVAMPQAARNARCRSMAYEGNSPLVHCQTRVLGLMVIPAQAGIQPSMLWIPASAGTTNRPFLFLTEH